MNTDTNTDININKLNDKSILEFSGDEHYSKFKYPLIVSMIEEKGVLNIKFSNIHHSIWNTLRIVLLTETKIYGFREEDCKILKNNSQFNDQILISRLMQIPVFEKNLTALDEYELYINVKNISKNICDVKTKDFQIRNKISKELMNEIDKNKIFPKNNISNDYILFTVLNSYISKNIYEELELVCPFSIVSPKINSSYAVALCFGRYSFDDDMALKAFEEKNNIEELGVVEYELAKKNFFAIGGLHEKYYDTNFCDFIIESFCVFTNIELLKMATSFTQNAFIDFYKECDDLNISFDNYVYNNKNENGKENGNIINIASFKHSFPFGYVLQYFSPFITFSFSKYHPDDQYFIFKISFEFHTSQFIEQLKYLVKFCIKYFKNLSLIL